MKILHQFKREKNKSHHCCEMVEVWMKQAK